MTNTYNYGSESYSEDRSISILFMTYESERVGGAQGMESVALEDVRADSLAEFRVPARSKGP